MELKSKIGKNNQMRKVISEINNSYEENKLG